jgi:UV DNA damage endonuclease
MKIGYPCINLSLNCLSSKTFRLASYSEDRMRLCIDNNLDCLAKILEYNLKHDLLFFRITSDLVPFASHPVCTFPWQSVYASAFAELGEFIRGNGMRVAMHPDQFVLINALNEDIFQRSVSEIRYHTQILDLFGLDETAKIKIHVGGVYHDKAESIKRFIDRYQVLPEKIKRRLVIENDERLYDIQDCLDIHQATKIPLVFDVFHFRCNNRGEAIRSVFSQVKKTWRQKDGAAIVDYSSQDPTKRTGAHAATVNLADFESFSSAFGGFDFDIMCEIKDKEKSALRIASALKNIRPRSIANSPSSPTLF